MTTPTKDRTVEEILTEFQKLSLTFVVGEGVVEHHAKLSNFFLETLQAERQKREEVVELGKREQVEYIENMRDHDSCECDNCHRWRKFKKNWDKRCKKINITSSDDLKENSYEVVIGISNEKQCEFCMLERKEFVENLQAKHTGDNITQPNNPK